VYDSLMIPFSLALFVNFMMKMMMIYFKSIAQLPNLFPFIMFKCKSLFKNIDVISATDKLFLQGVPVFLLFGSE
jgi:hypothetical protein